LEILIHFFFSETEKYPGIVNRSPGYSYCNGVWGGAVTLFKKISAFIGLIIPPVK
jgi:hypothetical protein